MGTFGDQYMRYTKTERFFNILDKFNVKPWLWIIITVLIVCVDYLSGPWIQFPILFIIPIAIVSWSGKRKYAILLSVILPCFRFMYIFFWNETLPFFDLSINVAIRMMIFLTIAYLTSYAKELRVLKGLLHICSYCGKFKSNDGKWISPQEFITEYSEAILSHGICMDCYPKVIRDFHTSRKET